MRSPELNTLMELRGHVQIVHHVPGRIRLRIAPSFLSHLDRVARNRVTEELRSLRGIRGMRINPAAGSIIIEYAAGHITPGTWELMLKGDRDDAQRGLQALLEQVPPARSGDAPFTELDTPSNKEPR